MRFGTGRKLGLVAGVAVLAIALGISIVVALQSRRPLDQSTFYRALAERRIERVTLSSHDGTGWTIRGRLRDDGKFTAYVLADPSLSTQLRASGAQVQVDPPHRDSPWLLFVSSVAMVLCAGLLLAHVFLRTERSAGEVRGFLRPWIRPAPAGAKRITFADVAGIEEAQRELLDVVELLVDPERCRALGGRIPAGVLLVGPPGCGKTLLARAVAGEARRPFFSISGSELVEMYVGVGAARVRELFARARKTAPCIVFVDELDAVGRSRGRGIGADHDEREQTLNQLLVELDGFAHHDGVIVLAATNRPDVLDRALLRPGRFDRQVVLDRPDARGREAIIGIHTRHVPLGADVEIGLLARLTPGFSGADLASLVNEAALRAACSRRDRVCQEDFERAKDKLVLGRERRSVAIGPEERRAMAVHEAGHALVAHLMPEADPLHKVTIVPRGTGGGATQQIPAHERYLESRSTLDAAICVLLGGRLSEELLLRRVSSHAGPDLERATRLARRMVTEWGMSSSVGPYAVPREPSEATASEIDRAVREIVLECHGRTREMLAERSGELTRVAEALLAHETLDAAQVGALVSPACT